MHCRRSDERHHQDASRRQSIGPPDLWDDLDRVSAYLLRGRLGLLLDFDGTLSEIMPTPAESTISAEAAALLGSLTRKLALVAVVSGRAVADLRDRVGLDGLTYVGNHGAEFLTAGRLTVAPDATRYRDRVKRVADHIKAADLGTGLVWEDKTYSVSAHFRLANDPAETRRLLKAAVASAPGADELSVFWGKMVLEIRSPTGLDKGYAVRRLVDENRLDGAIVVGDDTTDVDGWRALAELRAQAGIRGFSVAVEHPDTSAEVLAAADYRLQGVEGMVRFLRWLDGAAN